MHIDSRITTTSAAMEFVAEIERVVHELKVDRDTWEALALKYKAAFETTIQYLQELQDVCFATQAELENARAQQRRPHAVMDQTEKQHNKSLDVNNGLPLESYGTAVIYSPHKRRSSDDCANPLFDGVQYCVQKQDYSTALMEVERLLRGPLSPKARIEGLLLKSEVLQAIGPGELYDALAACSEAMELCDRLSGLQVFLPRIHSQRDLLYYDLRLYSSTLDATDSKDEDRAERTHCNTRRSGFDENRTINEELLAKIETKRRQTSAQFRQRAAAKAKRMSLPHRWTSPRSE
ncbi:hypothetical protein T440DRAFT_407842 [Plenodomus tracheiphilus IPT5]|uniref:Uncharacterized protein n=1 Tax=Plenodomus tracheiphilus IPT5 TaxID=1408161 RepID=A0A6A7ARY9_9PLEO|nr:hypothetical protein T440DRAFT_407842 [Plenodomus tracheiphilus IPT5]